MLKLLADENFNNDILRGVIRRLPNADIPRIQDIPEIAGKDDPTLLEWAAQEGRVLLTHDVRTITKYAYERIAAGLLMAGVFEIKRSVPIAIAVEEILIIVECSNEGEWEGQVRYLP
jgi:hypothetical protein